MREKCLKDARDELEIQVKSNLDDLLKRAILGLFSLIFGLFKQTVQILQQINGRTVHPVSGAETS